MREFVDGKNREWKVEITVDAARTIKEKLGFDVVAMKDGETLANLLEDPVRIVDTLWILVSDQADDAGIDEAKFGQGFSGDSLERGADCLVGAMIDFFPAKRRALLQRIWDQAKVIQERELEAVSKYLDSPELEAEIDEFLNRRMRGLTEGETAETLNAKG